MIRAWETSAPAYEYTSLRARTLNLVCKCLHWNRKADNCRLSKYMLLLGCVKMWSSHDRSTLVIAKARGWVGNKNWTLAIRIWIINADPAVNRVGLKCALSTLEPEAGRCWVLSQSELHKAQLHLKRRRRRNRRLKRDRLLNSKGFG